MTMGQRILAARLEAGLSQRQLAGEEITRNMLSAMEHDSANPSVATLRYLSWRLDKPVSYFLGEDVPEIPEYPTLLKARRFFDEGAYRDSLEALDAIEQPGEILGREISLLRVLAAMALGEEMTAQGRNSYAMHLLELAVKDGAQCPYFTDGLEERLELLRAEAGDRNAMPRADRALLVQARLTMEDGQNQQARRYLEAVRDQTSPLWNELMGRLCLAGKDYREAVRCFHRAEETVDVRRELEICYRELEDYKMAYYYAKK